MFLGLGSSRNAAASRLRLHGLLKRRARERHLRRHGATVVDEGAGHTKWRGPTGGRSVVPRDDELGPGSAITPEQRLITSARIPAARVVVGAGEGPCGGSADFRLVTHALG